MIVPGSRLLTWMILLVIPFGGVGIALPSAGMIASLLVAGFALIVLADAAVSWRCLNGLSVAGGGIVRLSKNRGGHFLLVLKNDGTKLSKVQVGLAFPAGIHSPQEKCSVALPPDDPVSQIAWSCIAVNRGVYRLDPCYLEAASKLGFWTIRRAKPLDLEIRVYPNILTERKHVPALFLRRGMFGIRSQHQVGKGKEFEKLREYQPGDSYEDIHWKATAKRGYPVTKVFQMERTQEVYVVIDTSRLSGRPDPRAAGEDATRDVPPILERSLNAGLILGRAAERQGDLFGMLAFGDRMLNFVRAQKGKAHYRACIEAMCRLKPENVTPDFDDVCSFIRTHLRRRALIVFLTQLDDPILAESFVRHMDLIRRQHLVIVNMLTPVSIRPLFSAPEEVTTLDDLYEELGGHLRWQSLRDLHLTLHRRGILFFQVASEKLSAHLVTQYMNVKQRQRL
jgi:uncharacterized protein (DUF58 family)